VSRREELIAYARQMGWRDHARPGDTSLMLNLATIDNPRVQMSVHFKIDSGHIDLAIGAAENGKVASVTGGVREVKRFLRERRHRR
jgi:hypothetical protein